MIDLYDSMCVVQHQASEQVPSEPRSIRTECDLADANPATYVTLVAWKFDD